MKEYVVYLCTQLKQITMKFIKEILFWILIYNIWNTPFYFQHIVLLKIILTLWIVFDVIEFVFETIKKRINN